MKKKQAIVSLLMVLAGAYLMAGFAYLFTAGHWPPYWPSMDMAAGILPESQGGLLMGTLVLGLVFLVLGPTLAGMGIVGLLMSRRR